MDTDEDPSQTLTSKPTTMGVCYRILHTCNKYQNILC